MEKVDQDGLTAEDKAFNLFAEMMIEKIESIQDNWQKPWFTEGSMWPKNLLGREYNGMNAFMLMFVCEKNGYRIPRFCTFKQVQDLNEEAKDKGLPRVSVKKGETSFPVLFTTFTCVHMETKEKIKYDDYKKLSPEKQELYKVYPSTQVFRVFNVAQTNLQEARPELWAKLEVEPRGPKIETGENYSFAPVDEMIQDNLWICPIIPKYQDNAYFSFSENKIVVPEKTQFKDGESFYGTVFHEMTHSTGREGVLNRVKPTGMGSDEYAREELVAEMGAALVAQRYGMSRHIKEDSFAYLKAWVDKLKESPQFIKTTLGDVRKATAMMTQKIDYIAQKMEQEQQKDEIRNEPEYKQLDLAFDDPVAEVKYNAVDTLLEPAPLRKEVEFANVQRVFEESKAFQFSAPNKITQPRDVAYIFKQLETSAVENVFAVLVKDDKPTVIHLSMGTPRQSLVSLDSAIVADKKINADKIYFVHNHPSGSVHASPEDIALFNKWKHVFGDKLQPGIIINSRTGLFGEFSSDGHRKQSDLTLESVQPQYPIKLYSFSKLVFNKEYKEQGVIRCSSDVASFVAGHRLGARPKFSYLILSTNGSINANVHTAYSQIQQDKVRDLAQQIANDTNVFGGTVVITYGSTPLKQMQVKSLQEELKRRDIVLQDHINVQAEVNSLVMDAMGSPYKYQSASDDGWIGFMEPGMKYGKEKQEEKPVQGLNGYTREEIKEIVKNHIETIIQDAEVDAKVVGLEIHGSRGRGDARADSDLDVVVEYAGADKEYMMFNLLHSDPLYIEDLKVDVNPIRAQETGTLKEYMERSRAYDQEKLYGSDEKSQIEEANKRFNQELQLQAVGRLPRGHVYQLGMPSMVLNSAGIPNLPIEMAASRLSDKSMQENHPFGLNEVKNLVSAIQNPLAVFRSATHIGSNVILTELSHEGENFVAALRTHIQQGKIEINSVRSLYPKNNVSVAGWIENELMDYADKKRMAEWLSKQRSNSADVRKLFDHATKVVQNFENPKQHEKHPEPRYSSSIPVRRQPVVKPRKRGRGL